MEPERTHLKNRSIEFRDRLRTEFEKRVRTNPRYSLRAYARALGIYHATLSALLAGQRPFTQKSVKSIGIAIGLSPAEIAVYLKGSTANQAGRKKQFSEIEDDEYTLEARWQHDAILEYLQIPGRPQDARSLAAALEMTAAEVIIAMQLLERCKLISKNNEGLWQTVTRNTSNILGTEQTSAARRRYQRDLLEKSQTALEELPIACRDHTSLTFAIDSDDLPELKTIIKEYRRKILAFSQRKNAKPNQVYQLQVSLFPVTKVGTK